MLAPDKVKLTGDDPATSVGVRGGRRAQRDPAIRCGIVPEEPIGCASRIDIEQSGNNSLRTATALAEVKRKGGIVDDVWLIHKWAGEYNAVNITTYKSWAAIEDTTLGYGPALRKVFPDSVARKKITDRINWVFEGVSHRDNIYVKAE